MKNNFLILKIFAIFCLITLLTSIMPINLAHAAANGSHGINQREDTTLLIIGDSRMYQLYERKQKASFVTVWGGHYYGNNSGTHNINSDNNKIEIKRIINNTVRKYKRKKVKCRVFIAATINDYNGVGDYKNEVNRLVNFAEEVATYNKNAVVCVGSLIPAKNSNGTAITNFNKELKARAAKSKNITYINIRSVKVKYESDGLHFTEETSKALYKKIHSATYIAALLK